MFENLNLDCDSSLSSVTCVPCVSLSGLSGAETSPGREKAREREAIPRPWSPTRLRFKPRRWWGISCPLRGRFESRWLSVRPRGVSGSAVRRLLSRRSGGLPASAPASVPGRLRLRPRVPAPVTCTAPDRGFASSRGTPGGWWQLRRTCRGVRGCVERYNETCRQAIP